MCCKPPIYQRFEVANASNLVASMVWVLRNVEKSMFLRAFFVLANEYSWIQNL